MAVLAMGEPSLCREIDKVGVDRDDVDGELAALVVIIADAPPD